MSPCRSNKTNTAAVLGALIYRYRRSRFLQAITFLRGVACITAQIFNMPLKWLRDPIIQNVPSKDPLQLSLGGFLMKSG